MSSVARRALQVWVVTAALLALLGCQSLPPPPSPTPTDVLTDVPTDVPQATPEADEPTPAPSTETPGRLAYVGADGNVYVTTADHETKIAVTDNATTYPEGPGLSYHRLAWSPDGRLAFASVRRIGDDAQSKLYVVGSPGAPGQAVAQSNEHFVIYVNWSPVPCPEQPACRRLAYLIEEEEGVGLHLVAVDSDETQDRLLGLGRPFYFWWAPDGRQILWHTGGAERDNPDAQIALYDLDRDDVQVLAATPGLFHAPAWSPTGDHWLGVVVQDETDRLQLFETGNPTQPVTLTAAAGRRIAFAWSPSGDRVAYAVQQRTGEDFYGPIHVFNLTTGQSRRVTNVSFDIFAFFWSPDGRRIGYLSRLALPDSVWMQWRTYDVVEDQDRGFEAFPPSPLMRFTIHSFNQYTQSHRFWSPDGRYLVFAERDRAQVDRIWLVDTWAERGADPIFVDKGSIGFWSWE